MSQAYRRGPVCGTDNCESRRYRALDGRTFCEYGHVVEGEFEYVDDDDFTGPTTKRITQVTYDDNGQLRTSKQAERREKPSKVYGLAAKDLYYKCLQILLKHMLSSLDIPHSAKSTLEQVVKINWASALTSCYKPSKYSSSAVQIYTIDLLAIIYISLVQVRHHPIYATDLLHDVKNGKIPYFRCLHLIPQRLLNRLPAIYHSLLQPYRLPLYTLFYEHVAQNVARIAPGEELKIPLNYYYPFVMRTLTETLVLPRALDAFVVIARMNHHMATEIVLPQRNVHDTPEVRLLGQIMFVVRALFCQRENGEKEKTKGGLSIGAGETLRENHNVSPQFDNLASSASNAINGFNENVNDNVIFNNSDTFNKPNAIGNENFNRRHCGNLPQNSDAEMVSSASGRTADIFAPAFVGHTNAPDLSAGGDTLKFPTTMTKPGEAVDHQGSMSTMRDTSQSASSSSPGAHEELRQSIAESGRANLLSDDFHLAPHGGTTPKDAQNHISSLVWAAVMAREPGGPSSSIIDWNDDTINSYCDWIYERVVPHSSDNISTRRLYQIFDPAECPKHVAKSESLSTVIRKMLDETSSARNRALTTVSFKSMEERLHEIFCTVFSVAEETLSRSYGACEAQVQCLTNGRS